ncbi:MAG: hypothetical protein CXT71_05750 [Methanobacteriota archaeon]|jgi:hypothetical protein|nr:MAG: hypothetical protein CXT71_05750 [Euryarchaeota archaeon]
MRGALFALTLLLFSILPTTVLAQIEPKPEVSVSCDNTYEIALDPSRGWGEVPIVCNIQNDNPYGVEVEFNLIWDYIGSDVDNINLSPNSNEDVYFELRAEETAPPGMFEMKLEATVVEYLEVRECSDCPINDDTLQIKILAWTEFGIELISESPAGSYDFYSHNNLNQCEIDLDFSFEVEINVAGNELYNPTVGYSMIIFDDSYDELNIDIEINKPEQKQLNIEIGESENIDGSFNIESIGEYNQDVFVLFLIVAGEVDDVARSTAGESFQYNQEIAWLVGGCTFYYQSDNGNITYEPIIIKTSSDDSYIYTIAGAAGASTILLLIILAAVLLRRRK